MRPLKPSRAGHTLVELVIAVSAVLLLTGLVGTTVQRSNAVFRQAGTGDEADATVQRAVERIARELMNADRSTLTFTPNMTTGADQVSYRRASGFGGGSLVLGALQRVRFELAPGETNDGIDNDGDGLIDEGRIVLNADFTGAGQDVVLVEHVSELLQGELLNGLDDNGNGFVDEPGLTLTYDAASFTATVRISVSKRTDGGNLVQRTAETAVRVRND